MKEQIINMNKPLIFSLFLLALASFPILANATRTESSTYYDITFTDYNPNNLIFFSSQIVNETKYFTIGCDQNNGNLTVNRYDYIGLLENTRTGNFTCNSTGNSVNLWYWANDLILFPVILANSSLVLANFNVTDYEDGNLGISLLGEIETGVSNQPTNTSISTYLSDEPLPIVLRVYDYTIGMTYSKSNNIYIAWNFFDLTSKTFESGTIDKEIISNGLSEISKIYSITSEGNCAVYSNNCVFQFLFSGKSNQNNGYSGIYLREQRYGTFGYEYQDRGLIGFTTPYGFSVQTSGIDYWFYTHQYPFLTNSIYIRANQNLDRIWAKINYNYLWIPTTEQRLNDNDVNSLQPMAKNLTYSVCSGCVNTSYANNCKGIIATLNNTAINSTYAYFLNSISFSIGGWPDDQSYGTYITITDSYNASNNVSFTSNYGYSVSSGSSLTKTKRLIVELPTNASAYNITVKEALSRYVGDTWYCYTPTTLTSKIYLDILNDVSAYNLPQILVTNDNQGEIEAYGIFDKGSYNVDNADYFGIQTVKTACRCNDFVCSYYNTTSWFCYGQCSPPNCAIESYFSANITTAGEGDTPDLTEGVNETYLQPLIPSLGLPDGTPLGKLVNSLNSAQGFLILLIIGGGGYVSYKFGGDHKGLIFIIILLLGVLIGSFLGVFPIWIPIILGVLGIYLLVKFALGMYKGGG